jgi:IgGFc binding protein
MGLTTSSRFARLLAWAIALPACARVGGGVTANDGGSAKDGPSAEVSIQPPCQAGQKSCSTAGVPEMCDTAGAWRESAACAPGTTCVMGDCLGPCDVALRTRSYVGCEYWAATTLNRQLGLALQNPTFPFLDQGAVGVEGFPFAVALANPGRTTATITVQGGALPTLMTTQIPAAQTRVIQLPWVLDLVAAPTTGATTAPVTGTRVVARGGYHIQSDAPVVAYQFNPLTFSDQRRTNCSVTAAVDMNCFSYTNDASLLLPAHVLGTRYTVVSWPTLVVADDYGASESPGFITIVAASPGDTQVSVTLSAYALAGVGSNQVFAPGDTVTRTLHQGDAFQLLAAGSVSVPALPCQPEALFTDPARPRATICPPDQRTDLTGSLVAASAPVSVFAGHDCAFVPYNRYACDHLEEQLFPNETWGTRYAVSPTIPQLVPAEPTWVRVVSGANGNQLTLTPPVSGAPATLDRGQYFDFVTFDGVLVEGTGALLAVQFFVGQNYWSNDKDAVTSGADPAMVLEVPVEQWRTVYDFYVPATYVTSFVNLVVSRGAVPTLDGGPLPTFTRRPLGPYDVLQIDLSSRTGPHHLEAGDPFALKVYGFAPFTSYIYPGGLDLRPITVQ